MIPVEVENLQSQLVESLLSVDEFFAIILQSYDLDLCKESFAIHVSLSLSQIFPKKITTSKLVIILLNEFNLHELQDLYISYI